MPWLPRGKYVWDAWYARRGKDLHAFYLQADVEACGGDPERRHDLASIGHALASPSGWREAGPAPALAASVAPAWDDLALWTGSIVDAAPWAPFALFYTGRRRDDPQIETPHERQRPQQIGVAFSEDLTAWKRTTESERGPVIPNPGEGVFDGVAWRDPFVMRGAGGSFEAVICARLADAPPDGGAAIAHVTGSSPAEWGPPTVSVQSTDFYQMEVPQVFWRRRADRKRCYLLFSAQEKDCSSSRLARMPAAQCLTGTYWMASESLPLDFAGLPPLLEPARLLAAGLYAGKLLDPEVAESPALFGFPWPRPGEPFVGGISEPLAVGFSEDGGLAVLPQEVKACLT